MTLPEIIRVKLSSEAAEYVSITPVVVQEITVRELVEHMLGITGKDEARVWKLLLRGTLVSGASRFRWTGWEADRDSIRSLLATFPDPDPERPFAADLCVRAVLRSARLPIEIPREAGLRKPALARMLRRTSFWDVLMEAACASAPRYCDYSYKERADRYQIRLSAAWAERLREASRMVRYTALAHQIRDAALDSADLYVTR